MNEHLTTFLYEMANFVVFALLLGWIFVRPIRRMLDQQAAKEAQIEQSAKQHLAEAEQLRQQLIDDRRRFNQEMEHQRQAILSETKLEAARLLQTAQRHIAEQRGQLAHEALRIQQAQLTDLAGTVASAARQVVSNLLKQINGPQLENALIESACRQLRQMQPRGKEKILVKSAEALDDLARQKIAMAVGAESANGVIQYEVDQELLGGLRIKTPGGLIDHSIVALSHFAEQDIRLHLNQSV